MKTTKSTNFRDLPKRLYINLFLSIITEHRGRFYVRNQVLKNLVWRKVTLIGYHSKNKY